MNEIAPDVLRVGYVPGVTVSKWARVWRERFGEGALELVGVPQAEQEDALRDGRVDMCFVRLPIDRDGRHAIPLYRELPVVVVPADHPIAAFEQVSTDELVDERMRDASDVDTLAATLALLAAVGGAVIVPHSLARLHHRRDLVYREVTDLPPTEIALAWPVGLARDAVEDFIGVVRGRSPRSARGRQGVAATGDSSSGRTGKSSDGKAGNGRAAQSKLGAGKPSRTAASGKSCGTPRNQRRGRR